MLQEWQQRVVDERNELGDRLTKLEDFLDSLQPGAHNLDDGDLALLIQQEAFMGGYLGVLEDRIARFAK